MQQWRKDPKAEAKIYGGTQRLCSVLSATSIFHTTNREFYDPIV